MMRDVRIYEVGPRDGLQNEPRMISTAHKVRLIDLLSQCGFEKIETTSFVSPKWVPQMGDGAAVMGQISRHSAVDYAVLTPNMRGLEAALLAQADEVAIFGSASEGFSQKNINCTIAQSLERFAPLAQKACESGVKLRGYLSCVIRCPYDGDIAPKEVAKWARALLDLGCYEISLGDTIGAGTPENVAQMLKAVCAEIPPEQLAGHFHDTNGQAIDNIACALEHDLRVFDSAIGGLGGCPYAPGAPGNVDTQKVVAFCHDQGLKTGVSLEALPPVSQFAQSLRT